MASGKFIFLQLAGPIYSLLHLAAQSVPISSCGYTRISQTYGSGLSRCVKCPVCPPGQGASVECGTTVSGDAFIGCVPCTPGVNFSKHHDHSTCQFCGHCENEVIKQSCTNSTNIICGDCKKGYYRASTARACKRCSVCCNDGKDIKVPKCLHDGMPLNVQCELRPTECRPATVPARSSTPKPNYTTPGSYTENASHFNSSYRKPTQLWFDEAQNGRNTDKRHDVKTLQRKYPSYVPIVVMIACCSVAGFAAVFGWSFCGRHRRRRKIGTVYDGVELVVKGTRLEITPQVNAVSNARENTTSQFTECAHVTYRENGLQSTAVQTGGSLGDLFAIATAATEKHGNLDKRSFDSLTEEQKLAMRISKLPHTFIKEFICIKLNIIRIDSNDFRKLGEIIGANRVYIDGLYGNPKITDPAFKLITEKCAELTVKQFLLAMIEMERDDVVTVVKNFLNLVGKSLTGLKTSSRLD